MSQFQVEVTEMVARQRTYVVEADSFEEAVELAENGETLEEFQRGDDAKNEIVGRQAHVMIQLPDTPLEVEIALTMGAPGWLLLRHQKHELIAAIERGGIDGDVGDGLLNLIDAIQDYAVDKCGVPAEIVFRPADPDENEDENEDEDDD